MNDQIKFTELAHLQDRQLKALETIKSPECKYFLYGGAAGGGKSYLLRWTALNLAIYYFTKYGIKNVPIGLFSEDYPTLKDRQISRIKGEFPKYLGKIKDTKDEGLAFFLNPRYGAARIMLRNLDDPSKYASVEFAAILVEELTKNKAETFDDLRSRLRYPGIKDVKFVAATNPGEIGHGWVKKKFITKDKDDPECDRFFFLHADVRDNKYLDTDYVKQLESLPEQKRKALLEGSWDVFAGQFFSEWRTKIHVVEPRYMLKDLPSNYQIRLTWDDGTSNPRSAHIMVQDVDRYIEVVWEYYKTGETAAQAASNIYNLLDGEGILNILQQRGLLIYDPSMDIKNNQTGYSTAQIVSDILGISKQPGNNNRIEGARRYREYLKYTNFERPILRIWSNCVNLTRTLPELVVSPNNSEDINTDGEDHAYDDTRYGIMSFTSLPNRMKSLSEKSVTIDEVSIYKPQGGYVNF